MSPDAEQELLTRVKRAYTRKRKAEADIRTAVLEARDAGISQPKIAKAAGVSQATVWELERTARTKA